MVSRAGTNAWRQPPNGFYVVIKYLRPGAQNRPNGIQFSVEVWGQHFDNDARIFLPNGGNGPGKMRASAVGKIIAGNSGNNDVLETHPLGGFGNALRLVFFEGERFGRGHSAESACSRAMFAGDHEGGGSSAPTFPAVGTFSAFADVAQF